MKRPWSRTIRRETGLIEHICEHGIGHPAVGSADWKAIMTKDNREDNPWMVHGCDGCCSTPEWQIASLKDSVWAANEIIVSHHKLFAQMKKEKDTP